MPAQLNKQLGHVPQDVLGIVRELMNDVTVSDVAVGLRMCQYQGVVCVVRVQADRHDGPDTDVSTLAVLAGNVYTTLGDTQGDYVGALASLVQTFHNLNR